MADQIADGMRLSSARRALNQHAAVFFELFGDPYLFGICGLAQENIGIGLAVSVPGGVRFAGVGNRGFFSHNIQERPRQIFARSKVRENALDSSGEAQGAGAQK